jgi:predicted aldo/keto reductase-like oxidoreductase
MFNKAEAARGKYEWWRYAYEVQKSRQADTRAVNCVQCRQCESKCPQKIPISRWLQTVASVMGEGKPFVSRLE